MFTEGNGININRQIAGAKAHRVGEYFEAMIDASLRAYRDEGVAYIEKTPEPMKPIKQMGKGKFLACYTKQGQPDFKGTLKGGRSIVFEAKHTNDDKIPISRLTDEQYRALETHRKLGADAYVMVSFGLESFYRIPFDVWCDIPAIYGHKHVKRAEIPQFKLNVVNGRILLLDGIEVEYE